MSSNPILCPRCQATLATASPPATCPRCGQRVEAANGTSMDRPAEKYPVSLPHTPPPSHVRGIAAGERASQGAVVSVFVGLALLLLTGAGIAAYCYLADDPQASTEPRTIHLPPPQAKVEQKKPPPPEKQPPANLPPKEKPEEKPRETETTPASAQEEPKPPPKQQENYVRDQRQEPEKQRDVVVKQDPEPDVRTPAEKPPQVVVQPKKDEKGPLRPVPPLPPVDEKQVNLLPQLLPVQRADKESLIAPAVKPKEQTLKFQVLHPPKDDTPPRPFRIAVTPPQYDHLGLLLKQLGAGYQYSELADTDLRDVKRLTPYNVIFLTCSTANANDGYAARGLRQFVEQGGTLYASDLRYELVARAFPEYVDRRYAISGIPQKIKAKVNDAGLKRILGSEVMLGFESPGWMPAAFSMKTATAALYGTVETGFTKPGVAPLMVKFRCKKGTVIFTSFHNAAQGDVGKKLLQYMVFSAVNAPVEAKLKSAMVSAGYTVHEIKTLNLSQGYSLTPQTFQHNAGNLQVAVGFQGNAKLRLRLLAPSGELITHEDTGTFTVQVDSAPAGAWQYSVTAVETPYPNFPYTIAIGEGKLVEVKHSST